MTVTDGELDDYVNKRLTPDQVRGLQTRLAKDKEGRERLWAKVETKLAEKKQADRTARHKKVVAKVARVVVLSLLLLFPIIAMVAVFFWSGDYGLALAGWETSAQTNVHRCVLLISSAMPLAWLWMKYMRLLNNPWFAVLASGGALVASAVACQAAISNYAEEERYRREQLVQNHAWISYDSAHFWPDNIADLTGHPAQQPTLDQIRKELELLRGAEFTGLFLHGCLSSDVPRIAKELGFGAVIQGIHVSDPRRFNTPETQAEIQRAMAANEFIDGYFLGELQAREVDFVGLKAELARIRRLTNKMVTTSFVDKDYIGPRGERIRALEDFTIRSLARPWRENRSNPKQAVDAVNAALESLRLDDKPALLTTVFYPTEGGDGFTEDGQYEFFLGVSRLNIPMGTNYVAFNSFDRPWAKRLSEVGSYTPKWEGHTGLFSTEKAGDSYQFREKKAVAIFKQLGQK